MIKFFTSKMYMILENPRLYLWIQSLLAFGRDYGVRSITQLIQPRSHEKVLDIGCGPGRYGYLFQCTYVGVDINSSYLRHARHRDLANPSPRHYIQSRAGAMGFRGETFDYVMCIGLLHHISDAEVHQLMTSIKWILKPGGRACIFEAVYPLNFWNLPGHLVFSLDRGRFTRTKDQLDSILFQHGFKEAEFQIQPRQSFPYHQINYIFKKD